jgi:predicted dehydrogenase
MPARQSRRSFLQKSSALGIGFWIAGQSSFGQTRSPNQRIQFACIGVGGKGADDSAEAAGHGKVVAICDVDERTLDKTASQEGFGDARRYFDFRDMLDELGDRIDAVTISTPDHTHAVAAVMAMNMGKHCFCQKPLTHSVSEARLLGELARRKGVKTQMGNQMTAYSSVRRGAAVLKSGALGHIKALHVWTNRPVWPQGIERPTETPAVPSYLHWDEWIGPAPFRPYHPAYHPFKWRGFWDFGTGALGDMACHTLNLAFMGLDLREPDLVEATTEGHNQDTFPGSSKITYHFPRRGNRDALNMYWYDGGEHPDWSLVDDELFDWLRTTQPDVEDPFDLMRSGLLVIGEQGKLFSPGDYGDPWKLSGIDEPDIKYVQSPGHFTEWVEAIQGGPDAVSNFPDYAGPLTETVLVGNLAVWTGGKVRWDAKTMTPIDHPELALLVRPEYRDGWTLDAQKTAATGAS